MGCLYELHDEVAEVGGQSRSIQLPRLYVVVPLKGPPYKISPKFIATLALIAPGHLRNYKSANIRPSPVRGSYLTIPRLRIY